MLSNIKDSFVAHVNTLTWMDRDTKQATLEKSKEMISFIGYPEWLFDKGALDIYYQGVSYESCLLEIYASNLTFRSSYIMIHI